MATYKGKMLSQMSAGERQKRIAELVASHNTGAIKDAKYLPAAQRKQRELNTRLAQPIVAGSSVTNRDLAHQRSAATDLQFGANAVGKAAQQGKDVSGWFADYLRELNQHSQNVGQIGQQAQSNLTNIGSSIRGLDQSQLDKQVGSAQADAASRGQVVEPGVAQRGSDASAVRQALLASMQGVQNQQAAGSSTYADALAHVVGPGQKLQAQAQERGKLTDLESKIGAFRTNFDATTKADEAKTVLANQAFNLNQDKATNTAKTAAASRKAAAHKWAQATNTTYGLSNGAVAQLRKTAAGKARLEKAQAARDKLLHPPKSPSTTDKDEYGNTLVQRTSRTSDFRKALKAAQSAPTVKGQKKTAASVAATLSVLYPTMNQDVLLGAAQMALLKRVGPNTAKALAQLGVDSTRYRTK